MVRASGSGGEREAGLPSAQRRVGGGGGEAEGGIGGGVEGGEEGEKAGGEEAAACKGVQEELRRPVSPSAFALLFSFFPFFFWLSYFWERACPYKDH